MTASRVTKRAQGAAFVTFGPAAAAGWASDRRWVATVHQDAAQYADTRDRMLPALDALVATVDGTRAAPAGAEQLATPPPAEPFNSDEHIGSAVFGPDRPASGGRSYLG